MRGPNGAGPNRSTSKTTAGHTGLDAGLQRADVASRPQRSGRFAKATSSVGELTGESCHLITAVVSNIEWRQIANTELVIGSSTPLMVSEELQVSRSEKSQVARWN